MSVGENVRRIRDRRGLTQTELADRVMANQSMIAMIETDRKLPGLLLARELAAALDVTMETLVDGEATSSESEGKRTGRGE